MTKNSWIGLIMGSLFITFSKFFWTEVCFLLSNDYSLIENEICQGFENFFYYVGIIAIVVSAFGIFRKK